MEHYREPSDESNNGWLASSCLGCCASTSRNEEDRERLRAGSPEREMIICYEQPDRIACPNFGPVQRRPSQTQSMTQQVSGWVTMGREFAAKLTRSASLNYNKRRWKGRPEISDPSDFRKISVLPRPRRKTFRPIELSFYCTEGQLSPLPDFNSSEWNRRPAELAYPAQARVRRRTDSLSSEEEDSDLMAPAFQIQRKPVGSSEYLPLNGLHSRSNSDESVRQPQPSRLRRVETPDDFEIPPCPVTPPIPVRSPSRLSSRSRTPGSITAPHLASPFQFRPSTPKANRARSNTEPSRPSTPVRSITPTVTPRSSLRRLRPDPESIDSEIRELNTIVEERRAAAAAAERITRPNTPANVNATSDDGDDSHIPAIAPSRRMHVRSETLSDIGSAFSVPLATKPLPTTPSYTPCASPMPASIPLPMSPDVPPMPSFVPLSPLQRPQTAAPEKPSARARLSLWLRRSLPSTPILSHSKSVPLLPPSSPVPAPFYKCIPPPSAPAAAPSLSTLSSESLIPTSTGTDSAEGDLSTRPTSLSRHASLDVYTSSDDEGDYEDSIAPSLCERTTLATLDIDAATPTATAPGTPRTMSRKGSKLSKARSTGTLDEQVVVVRIRDKDANRGKRAASQPPRVIKAEMRELGDIGFGVDGDGVRVGVAF